MSNINHTYIEDYVNQLLLPSHGILREMENYACLNKIPIITKDVSALLEILVKSSNSKRILEIGTAIGYSSILMGMAMNKDFEIITIEKEYMMVEIAKQNVKKAGYKDNIKIIQGDALEVLDNINNTFDIIFLDAAKGHYLDIFEKSIPKLKIGGLFICDNVLFRGMVAERKLVIRRKITIVKRLKKFLQYISNNDFLQTSIVPIGDGLSISLKLKEVVF